MTTGGFRHLVLASYKRLLQVQQLTFKGDVPALIASKKETRKQYQDAAHITDETHLNELIQKANDVASYLEHNIVQAIKKDEHHYVLQYDPKRHELNDNNEVNKPYVRGKRIPCCGPGSEALPRLETPK